MRVKSSHSPTTRCHHRSSAPQLRHFGIDVLNGIDITGDGLRDSQLVSAELTKAIAAELSLELPEDQDALFADNAWSVWNSTKANLVKQELTDGAKGLKMRTKAFDAGETIEFNFGKYEYTEHIKKQTVSHMVAGYIDRDTRLVKAAAPDTWLVCKFLETGDDSTLKYEITGAGKEGVSIGTFTVEFKSTEAPAAAAAAAAAAPAPAPAEEPAPAEGAEMAAPAEDAAPAEEAAPAAPEEAAAP